MIRVLVPSLLLVACGVADVAQPDAGTLDAGSVPSADGGMCASPRACGNACCADDELCSAEGACVPGCSAEAPTGACATGAKCLRGSCCPDARACGGTCCSADLTCEICPAMPPAPPRYRCVVPRTPGQVSSCPT